MFPGKKLQFFGKNLQSAGKKLQGEEINLQILGDRLIFVETFRKFEIPVGNFLE